MRLQIHRGVIGSDALASLEKYVVEDRKVVAMVIDVGTRGRPRKKETSEKILSATYSLLTEIPYSEVSYEKIAERAKVTRPTIGAGQTRKPLSLRPLKKWLSKLIRASPMVGMQKRTFDLRFIIL